MEAARIEARSLGLSHYMPDTPCKRGHLTRRHVRSGGCLECWAWANRKANQSIESWAKYSATSAEANIRRAYHERQATPLWADRRATAAVYAEAVVKTAQTGVKWSVDHLYPLQGVDEHGVHVVCGLHVASNLQVILASDNSIKRNRCLPALMQWMRVVRKPGEVSKTTRAASHSACRRSATCPAMPPLQPAGQPGAHEMNAIDQVTATLAPADSGTVAKLTREQVRAKRYPSQTKHEARRSASLKDSAGGQVVEAVKEASKRTPKGKSANKPGNPVCAAGRAPVQNGVKSPRGADGTIARAWAIYDEFPETTAANLPDYCEAYGLNLSNMTQELYRWRRFNGLTKGTRAK